MVHKLMPLCMLTALLLIGFSVRPAGADGDLEALCKAIPVSQAIWNYFMEGRCAVAHNSAIDATMSYFDAQQSCNDIPGYEGHIAVFPDDFAIYFPMLPYIFPVTYDFTGFLGLEQHKTSEADEPDKNWFWVFPDGSRNPLPSGFWLPGQPYDPNGTLNYGAFMRRGNQFGLGNVDSLPVNGYMCEYDSVLTTGRIPSGGTPPPVTDTTPTTKTITTPKTKPTTSITRILENTTSTTSTRVGGSSVNVTTAAVRATNTTAKAAALGTRNTTEAIHDQPEKTLTTTTAAKKGDKARYSSIFIVFAAMTASRIGDLAWKRRF